MDEIVWGMSWEDWAGNFCYLLLAVSYLVTSLLWLRILAIAALGLEGIYFYFASTPPLWVGIAWAAVFVGINLFQIMRMTRERLAIRMTETERLLHRGLFKELGPVGFHRLLKIGAWRQMPAGTVLTSQGEPVPELYFISRGVARVIVDGKDVAALQSGTFVGEMSFMSGGDASATVVAAEPLEVFAIAKPDLDVLLKRDSGVEAAILRVLGRDLAAKLKTQHR